MIDLKKDNHHFFQINKFWLTKVSIVIKLMVSIDTLFCLSEERLGMHQQKRPTPKEIYRKIEQAKQAVEENNIELAVEDSVIFEDALELGYDFNDLRQILLAILDEIKLGDYVGTFPPRKAYRQEIKGGELFEFRFNSNYLAEDVYIKFVLKGETLWLSSLHKNRTGRGYNVR